MYHLLQVTYILLATALATAAPQRSLFDVIRSSTTQDFNTLEPFIGSAVVIDRPADLTNDLANEIQPIQEEKTEISPIDVKNSKRFETNQIDEPVNRAKSIGLASGDSNTETTQSDIIEDPAGGQPDESQSSGVGAAIFLNVNAAQTVASDAPTTTLLLENATGDQSELSIDENILSQMVALVNALKSNNVITETQVEEESRTQTTELDADQAEAEAAEAERIEAEIAEAEAERLETERAEAARAEAARLEAEQAEIERLELQTAQLREAQRLEKEKLEAERLEAQKIEAERAEAATAEAKAVEAAELAAEEAKLELLEAEITAARETQRLEAEQREAARIEAEQLEVDRAEAEIIASKQSETEQAEAENAEEVELLQGEPHAEEQRVNKVALIAVKSGRSFSSKSPIGEPHSEDGTKHNWENGQVEEKTTKLKQKEHNWEGKKSSTGVEEETFLASPSSVTSSVKVKPHNWHSGKYVEPEEWPVSS